MNKLSPCILAWGRYALLIRTNPPTNNKNCSYSYWCQIIDYLLSNEKYESYKTNKEYALKCFHYVEYKKR
jgi:hypothetical protein